MGFFGFDSDKKIKRDEFRKAIRSIPELSPRERAYVEGVFQKALKDGISKYELKKEIQQLRRNTNDPLTPYEVGKIKQRLLERLK